MALLSYAHGSGDSPLLGVTVGQLLDNAARRWPDQEAAIVVEQNIRWTWRELRDRARAFGAGLLALGLEPGDRVGMLAPNRAEWLVTQFGTAYAGLILVNINPAYRTPELEYALNKVGCRALVTEDSFKTSDYIAMMNELAPELADTEAGDLQGGRRLPDLRMVIRLGDDISPGMFNFDDVSRGARCPNTSPPWTDDQPTVWISMHRSTSSSRAARRAPRRRRRSRITTSSTTRTMSAAVMRFTEHDKLCMPVPMYHCFGMVLGTLLCTASGATLVLPSAAFEGAACLHAIDAERCTAVHGVPTMFIGMLDDPDFAELRHDMHSAPGSWPARHARSN